MLVLVWPQNMPLCHHLPGEGVKGKVIHGNNID